MKKTNIILCSSIKDGKVVDLDFFYDKYSLIEYERSKEADGFICERMGAIFEERFLCERDSDENVKKVSKERTKWSIRVRCMETGRCYDTVRDCSKDVGISGYRIRRVLDTDEAVDGLHFRRLFLSGKLPTS